MDKPLVSVITITRNRAQLIGRCISSVLCQTYTNIEHIIVDGASDDETDDVVASFDDKRVHYIKLESNWPIVDTINHGFQNSHGLYITFLDSDDEYVPSKIEEQVKLFETLSEDFGMVYCWMSYFDTKSHKHLYDHSTKLRGYVLDAAVSKPLVSGTPTFMFRRDVFDKLGGWKDVGLVNDWELGARCCRSWKVDYVPKSLVKVYVNHGSDRMSDTRPDTATYERYVKFHKYFLSEYRDVFDRSPKLGERHYYSLSLLLMSMRKWREGLKFYKLLLKVRPKIKYFFLPIFCVFNRVK